MGCRAGRGRLGIRPRPLGPPRVHPSDSSRRCSRLSGSGWSPPRVPMVVPHRLNIPSSDPRVHLLLTPHLYQVLNLWCHQKTLQILASSLNVHCPPAGRAPAMSPELPEAASPRLPAEGAYVGLRSKLPSSTAGSHFSLWSPAHHPLPGAQPISRKLVSPCPHHPIPAFFPQCHHSWRLQHCLSVNPSACLPGPHPGPHSPLQLPEPPWPCGPASQSHTST